MSLSIKLQGAASVGLYSGLLYVSVVKSLRRSVHMTEVISSHHPVHTMIV